MADEQLPAPLTPPDCNLSDFQYVPVDTRRLLKSDTWSLSNGNERAAAVALWFESWHQVPAASLPNNERLLAKLADAPKWAHVREQALRGWVLCSDGRLYHPVVAEKALEAWIEKLVAAITGAAGNSKRWHVTIDTTADTERLQMAVALLQHLQPKSKALKKPGVLKIVAGSPPDIHPTSGAESGAESGGDRNRAGTEQSGIVKENPSGSPAAPAPTPSPSPSPAPTPAPTQPPKPPAVKAAKGEKASRKCPADFTVTADMVEWANREYPNVDPEQLRKETQAMRDHTFATGRVDWPGVWRNWIKTASERMGARSIARGATPIQTARAARAAAFAPGIADNRAPPSRTLTPDEVSDVEARPIALQNR